VQPLELESALPWRLQNSRLTRNDKSRIAKDKTGDDQNPKDCFKSGDDEISPFHISAKYTYLYTQSLLFKSRQV
jgi:hypothetical protein